MPDMAADSAETRDASLAGGYGARSMVTPVILSGGSGTRLWPLSRTAHPKQFQPFGRENASLLGEAVRRNAGESLFAPPTLIGHADHRFLLAEELRLQGLERCRIILEPERRDTAAAVITAALWVSQEQGEGLVLVAPSDHRIDDLDAYRAAVESGCRAALDGALVTFGIVPTRPETGYGYVKRGQSARHAGCWRLDRFLEKPDRETAERFLSDGSYFWNSGIFLFRADSLLEEARRLAPAIVDACRAALADGRADGPFLWLDAKAFRRCPAGPVDTVIMEKTNRGAVVPLEAGWNDVGSWQSLWEVAPRDEAGNSIHGDIVAKESRGCFLWASDTFVATIGVEDLVVVATADAILICPRDHCQQVKGLVEEMARQGRPESVSHVVVPRPWGAFETLGRGDRFQVKRLVVNPGRRLSVQMHYHRSEHWVVVRGTARILNGDEETLLFENQSTYIAAGTRHRLENPGLVPLELIEVQSGSYLGEDDIVRFDDDFGRVP